MTLERDARQLLANGSLVILGIPRPSTTFVLPTGHGIEWRCLESHFGPLTWFGWAEMAVRTRPLRMPDLADFIARHDISQRGADPGVACVVIAERDGSFTRVLVPNVAAPAAELCGTVAHALRINIEEARLLLGGSHPFVGTSSPHRRTSPLGWSPYFDASGRHIADRAG